MKRWLYIFLLMGCCCANAFGHGTVVLFNNMFRNSHLIAQLPMQYVEVDGEYKSQLLSSHYLEIHLPAGFHQIDLYSNFSESGRLYGSYSDAKIMGQAIHLDAIDVREGETTYINAVTGFLSDVKSFNKKVSAKHPLVQSPALWLVPQSEHATTIAEEKSLIQPQSDVDISIPLSSSKNELTFVVIIANEDYESVADVPFARNDGLTFARYAEKTLGIPNRNIHIRENATLNHMRAELNWLSQVCDAFDGQANVIFYYAGHGFPDETNHAAYLLPVDGMGTDVTTGYKLDDLYSTLGQMPAEHITVFMDACFSGSKREEGMLSQTRGVAIKVKSGVPQGKTVVFSAAQGDETAYPNKDEGHGLFTYYLLKKLQDTKGNVTLHELGNYITTNVRRQSIVQNGKSQTPTITAAVGLGDDWKTWRMK